MTDRGTDAERRSDGEGYVEAADRALDDAYDEPLPIEAYVDRLLERPGLASHATKYLLDAIESMGTRTVVERGEEHERYRFFDDPSNDGEHAILGNTAVLDDVVDTLRSIAAGRGKHERIVWIDGPTATGKSEFKRCLIDGLRAYSKTPEGRKYTLEWNVATVHEWGSDEEDNWYESPVQCPPLAVFPREVRRELLEDLNERHDDPIDLRLDADLDPFSREAERFLAQRYRRQGRRDLFSAIADEKHCRVTNYVVDVGRSIGVLHSEDTGPPKQRLVGSWMPGMLQKLDSRGRKNPQAFSYDGVLAQGNGGVTVVEDATQHADVLQRLLNVADEGTVKIDEGTQMAVDTLLLVISNPDLEEQLDAQSEMGERDPLKALKRRLERHRFRYLTELSLEVELLVRELTGETAVWTDERDDDRDVQARVASSLTLGVGGMDGVGERELAPHAVEAAAMYDVVTRLEEPRAPPLDLVDKALLYDRGHVEVDGERRETEDVDIGSADDGTNGLPVTYTRDVIADLVTEPSDRSHPELAVEGVVTPDDVLDAMRRSLGDEPMFSKQERSEYRDRRDVVEEFVRERQEEDVLHAMLRDHVVDDETVEEYIEHVHAWVEDEPVETERGTVEPDPLTMKVFETERLGRFDEDDYGDGGRPRADVERFREERIVTALNVQAWEHRDEGFAIDDVDVTEIPAIASVRGRHDWDDVLRIFEGFDPAQWDDPPSDTVTARVKRDAIEAMVEDQGYTEASAELTTRAVMREVADGWA